MSTVTPLPQPRDTSAIVAAEIRVLLARHGVTQRDLAVVVGVSQSQFSKRMRGSISFNIEELDKIAKYFGVSVATLVGGTGGPGGDFAPDGGGVTVSYPQLADVVPLRRAA